MKLSEMRAGTSGTVRSLGTDERFLSRITSIGLTPGCRVTVIKNEKNRPLLVYSRDTMIALNRSESEQIEVEGGMGA